MNWQTNKQITIYQSQGEKEDGGKGRENNKALFVASYSEKRKISEK